MKKYSTILAALTLLLLSCNQTNPYEAYAEEFCACVQPYADLSKRIDSLSEDPSEEEMNQLYADGQKADADVQTCLMRLQEKFKDLDMEKEKELMDALEKKCPHILELMQQNAQPQQDFSEPETPETEEQQ
ncbi:MAG: hypothetical protein KatS3mg029_0963 [Saprospiraceae bacterium]|nr:MAG: hypothetical protein KatS3mg029_0963 [Saprospiraceae bacterium]